MINEIQKILTDNQDQIVADIRQELVKRVTQNFGWEFESLVKKTVQEFYVEQIAPEIVKYLAGEKGVIIESVKGGCAQIGAKLAETMIINASKALTGYSGSDIIGKLVKG